MTASLETVYAAAVSPFDGRLDAAALVSEAETATGLSDWGADRWPDDRFKARVAAFCDALESEGHLNAAGRSSVHSRIHIILVSRLRQINRQKRNPPPPLLPRPLVGAGLPRAGTTFLHNLLCRDPENLFATGGQAAIPVPPPGPQVDEDARNALYNQALGLQGFTQPELTAIHPFAAEVPEECVFMQESSLFSPLGAYYNVPSMPFFDDPVAVADAYAWQKGIMQTLQTGRDHVRWALKAPSHLFTPDAMLTAFPDARVFMNHRDPGKVIPSMAGLYLAARGLSSDRENIDAKKLGPQLIRTWSTALEGVEKWRAANPQVPIIDVPFTDLIADPIAGAERVYAAFGLELSGAAKDAMRAFLATDSHGKGPARAYSLADFGIDEAAIEDAFGDYLDRYGIKREKRT